MKRFLVCTALVLGSVGFGANLQQLESSQSALVGALTAALGDASETTIHIPGYGLHIALSNFANQRTENAIATMSGLLTTLASTIKGLDEDDWLSVGYELETFGPRYELLVRLKPNKPETLEVFVNGKKQELEGQ